MPEKIEYYNEMLFDAAENIRNLEAEGDIAQADTWYRIEAKIKQKLAELEVMA